MDPVQPEPKVSIEELTSQLTSGAIDRRTFLRRGALLAISLPTLAAIVAACSSSSTPAPTSAPASTGPTAAPTAAASPSAAGAGQSDKPVIGFLLRNKLQSRWDFDEAGFIAEAQKLGVPYATSFTDGDTQEFQNAKAEAMLAAGTLKALVLVPFGELAIQPILDAAHAKGCKVIGYGNIIPGLDFSLIRDNEKVGTIMGESAKAYAPKGNYAFSWGAVGNDVGEGKKKGSLSVLQPLVDSGDIKVISEQHTTDWASTGVQTQIEAALTLANNDIKAIVCSWDTGAIGAYAAVKAAGIDKTCFITGEDADPTRVQLIAAGYPAMTTFEPYPLQGATGADVAYALATGADLTKPINNLPIIQVTAPDGSKYPGIQFKSISLTKDNLIDNLVKPGLMTYDDVYKLTPEADRPPKP
jgi:D-xylose transport system substrate-binding protein